MSVNSDFLWETAVGIGVRALTDIEDSAGARNDWHDFIEEIEFHPDTIGGWAEAFLRFKLERLIAIRARRAAGTGEGA